MTTTAETIRAGLRFEQSQFYSLTVTADSLRAFSPDDVRLMLLGADAARSGEPLIVNCSELAEAERIADVFTRHGLKRPAVEELSGPGG